ncbi:MAG: cbb3-type cytochrome c oxidase subunit 3 [Burkholderiales bacterium]|jgi:cytochrome c oxidase cbb3-type subunit 4|nr:cbb3-type cytochrome c oxidase subunit 3 [Burkholderiales bacterium]
MSTSFLGSVLTVCAFLVFIGIVIWAFSSRRKKDFDEAARAPFALDEKDESSRDEKFGNKS